MSEPEIARRCPTCGASIREVALFCAQCGNGLPQPKGTESQTPVAAAAQENISKTTGPLNDAEIKAQQEPMSDTVRIEKAEAAPKAPAGPRARAAVGAKIQRATTLARGVEGDVVLRVKKVRKISSVVLDEAGYDPSLRFVLVAAVLFVLFLVIVLLNKVIA